MGGGTRQVHHIPWSLLLGLNGLIWDRNRFVIFENWCKLPPLCVCRSPESSMLVGWKPHKLRRCSILSYAIPRYSSKGDSKSCYVPGDIKDKIIWFLAVKSGWVRDNTVSLWILVVKVRYTRLSSCWNPSLNFKCNVMLCFFLFIYLKRVIYMFFVV